MPTRIAFLRLVTQLAVICLVTASTISLGDRTRAAEPAKVSELLTVAETSQFKATGTGADTELFLKRLARLWPETQLESLGQTVEGREIWGLVVPPSKGEGPVITMLLLGGIHSGECDGKEALLALVRDYAGGKHSDNRTNVRLILVPNFNADGNERRGPLHRPGQAGPEEGMGIRENAQGLDLNRDFIKLETPEVRALVGALERWNVDVLLDAHTTNGSLHRYDLTYSVPSNPAAPEHVRQALHEQLLPAVTEGMAEAGIHTFYYGNFEDEHRSWKSFGHEPRYSIELMGLRGKIGILAESYSYASYERRVEVTYKFVDQIVTYLNGHAEELRAMLDANRVATSNDGAGAISIPLQAQLVQTREQVTALGYQSASGELPRPPYSSKSSEKYEPHDYQVGLWVTAEPTLQTKLPRAYAVSPNAAWALSRVKMQGIAIDQLQRAMVNVQGETYTIESVEPGLELQNHKMKSVTASTQPEPLSLAAGTYIVRTNQPLGVLAAYLLEPASEDGLAAWNFFDPDLKVGSEYPVKRVLVDLPPTVLQPVDKLVPSEKLTLDHVLKPGSIVEYFSVNQNGATWMAGGNELVLNRKDQWQPSDQWLSIDPATGASRPNVAIRDMREALKKLPEFEKDADALKAVGPAALKVDQKFGLFNYKNDLYFFDAASGQAKRLTDSPKIEEELAELSPTGTHVAYVHENDLYLVDCQSGQEQRLTKDGSRELLNGILDWVYQEEIYGRGQFRAFWFSPNGQQLAFLQLDQTPVLGYSVSDSIHYRQELEETRYPKAGDPLPVARMWLASVADGSLREVDLSDYPADDRLVVRVTWSPENQLWLQLQNRIQTEQSVIQVDANSYKCERLIHEKSPGWIEVLGQPHFLPGGDFLWLSDLPAGRRHLHRFVKSTKTLKPLTTGNWDITDLQAVTQDGKTAFVSGNYTHPTELQLMSIDTESGKLEQITYGAGTHRTRLSEDCRYLLDTWSSLNSPPRTVLQSLDGQVNRTLSSLVSDRYKYMQLADPLALTIPARDGLPMQAMIMLPPSWKAGSGERLPVLFHVYAGPQAPTVNNAWGGSNYMWHQYLCSQGFAVVLCDNRSSRGRGISDTWKIHRDLGKVELQDIEDAVDWVSQQPWADAQRVGIWGWSYGGYMTAYALTHSQKFKAGISGAPVTDWRNYDAVYTERYMDLPQNNEAGYKSSSAVEAAADLHGRLLLLHGERDDNVHISNTLQLAYALQKAGKPFDMMIYPKNRHGVVDAQQKYHMYSLMTEFLEKHLK